MVLFVLGKLLDKIVKKIFFVKENKYEIEFVGIKLLNSRKEFFVGVKDVKYKMEVVRDDFKEYN